MRKTTDFSRPVVRFDEQADESAKTLIANMIITPEQAKAGVVSRLHEQGNYKIEPDMLPGKEWMVARMTLRIMESLAAEKIPATKEAILNALKLDAADEKQAKEFERYFAGINTFRTIDANVTFLAFNLRDWMDKATVIAGIDKAKTRAMSAELSAEEAYIESMKIMSASAPRSTSVTTTDDDFMDFHLAAMNERRARKESGLPPAPNFPWKGLSDKIAGLKLGELCTILAKSGHGKTLLGLIIAEHIAHVLGYDVGYFHLETSRVSMADRHTCRKLRVTTRDLRLYNFTPDKEPHKKPYENLRASWRKKNQTKGRISFKGQSNMSPSIFKAEVEQLATESAARGRQLVVMVDYYTEFDWTELQGAKDMYAGYNLLAGWMKFVAETCQVYMICFGQYGVDEEYSGKKAGFGGQKINQRSQIVIRLEREDPAEEDMPVTTEKGGVRVQKYDTMGRPMFYHRKGEIHADSILRVVKASDDELGPVPVRFLNAYFDVFDNVGGRTEIMKKRRMAK